MAIDPDGAGQASAAHVAEAQPPHRPSFWIRELPFSVLLLLTIGGVAYTSFSKHPILIYWEILAPIIGLVMNMVFFASVQRLFTATSTALAIFTLLALGTFTAGVHILSWQVCLLGLIMAFGIPALAWIENSALLLVLVAAVVVGIGGAVWWHLRERRRRRI